MVLKSSTVPANSQVLVDKRVSIIRICGEGSMMQASWWRRAASSYTCSIPAYRRQPSLVLDYSYRFGYASVLCLDPNVCQSLDGCSQRCRKVHDVIGPPKLQETPGGRG